ncbi:class I SAM-dependent rRNA methyltransferase [Desulfovibrio sp. ZJ369]|uniref:class I SAM-dependent rRNA methyltransferase n=1 Tax=Desulfovibrio sp. ZJ369 TaxID=2709793 RepID=UPI0013EDFD8E|nr:class I SAM-dependent rRNA methyltransferase [Desulfovibrio sp. ZJ369]
MRKLWLKKNEDRRLRAGHLWVFSNEVDVQKSPLTDFAPGEEVTLCDARGATLGSACLNPASLICARLHSRQGEQPLDAALLRQRLGAALALRERLYSGPWYRLCHGEGDFLPGLVIDRYGDHLTIQISTAGMEARREIIEACLDEILAPATLFWDNDLAARGLEGLAREPQSRGTLPPRLLVPENGCRFHAPCATGQKTGWFYDQRGNRREAARYAQGADVLDIFCYAGGFGVTAAAAGAKSVTFLDASPQALALARENAAINAPDCPAETICGDAFQQLNELYEEGRRFSLICLDPPAFIKRRKDAAQGLAAYRKINALALRLLTPGGIVASSSCSHHLPAEALRGCVAQAAARRRLHARLLFAGGQGPDHPVHSAMPETAYLKCFIAQVG